MQITQAKESILTIELFEKEPKPLSLKIDEKFQRALNIINSYKDSPAASLSSNIDRFCNSSNQDKWNKYYMKIGCALVFGTQFSCMIMVTINIGVDFFYGPLNGLRTEKMLQIACALAAICSLVIYYNLSLESERWQKKTDAAKIAITINLENTWDKLPCFLTSKQSLLSSQIELLKNTAKKQVESLNDPKISFPRKRKIDQEYSRIKTLIKDSESNLKFCQFALAYFQGLNIERTADVV